MPIPGGRLAGLTGASGHVSSMIERTTAISLPRVSAWRALRWVARARTHASTWTRGARVRSAPPAGRSLRRRGAPPILLQLRVGQVDHSYRRRRGFAGVAAGIRTISQLEQRITKILGPQGHRQLRRTRRSRCSIKAVQPTAPSRTTWTGRTPAATLRFMRNPGSTARAFGMPASLTTAAAAWFSGAPGPRRPSATGATPQRVSTTAWCVVRQRRSFPAGTSPCGGRDGSAGSASGKHRPAQFYHMLSIVALRVVACGPRDP